MATPGAKGQPLFLGKDPSPWPYPFIGSIAEARMWNVARSNDDIGKTIHTAIQEKIPGLVAVWNLQDDLPDPVGGVHGTAPGARQARASSPARRHYGRSWRSSTPNSSPI